MYRPFLLAACSLLISCHLLAQENRDLYHRVQIFTGDRTISELGALGIATDHGVYLPDHSLSTEISATELEIVRKAGFRTIVLQADLQKWYADRAKAHGRQNWEYIAVYWNL
jgi:hypothetical protein